MYGHLKQQITMQKQMMTQLQQSLLSMNASASSGRTGPAADSGAAVQVCDRRDAATLLDDGDTYIHLQGSCLTPHRLLALRVVSYYCSFIAHILILLVMHCL